MVLVEWGSRVALGPEECDGRVALGSEECDGRVASGECDGRGALEWSGEWERQVLQVASLFVGAVRGRLRQVPTRTSRALHAMSRLGPVRGYFAYKCLRSVGYFAKFAFAPLLFVGRKESHARTHLRRPLRELSVPRIFTKFCKERTAVSQILPRTANHVYAAFHKNRKPQNCCSFGKRKPQSDRTFALPQTNPENYTHRSAELRGGTPTITHLTNMCTNSILYSRLTGAPTIIHSHVPDTTPRKELGRSFPVLSGKSYLDTTSHKNTPKMVLTTSHNASKISAPDLDAGQALSRSALILTETTKALPFPF